jgi:hypothetical protein
LECRCLKALTFQINNKGRLSGIMAKTALNPLYFIYCVSPRNFVEKKVKTRHEEEREYLARCKKKLEEVPEKNKLFWREQIRRSKKFLYGG